MCAGREETDEIKHRSGKENKLTGILLCMYRQKIFRQFRQINIYTGGWVDGTCKLQQVCAQTTFGRLRYRLIEYLEMLQFQWSFTQAAYSKQTIDLFSEKSRRRLSQDPEKHCGKFCDAIYHRTTWVEFHPPTHDGRGRGDPPMTFPWLRG